METPNLADFTWQLKAKSGYECEGEIKDITPEHYARIVAAIENREDNK